LNHPTRTLARLAAASLVLFATLPFAAAQTGRPNTMPRPAGTPPQQQPVMRQTPAPRQPMKKASELISRQAPISINRAVYDALTPAESRVVVNLTKQRAYLLNGDEVAIDSPISSGKRAGMTPTGTFNISEKDKDHRSNIYGDFKDKSGRTVRGGVSVRIDSAPSGTRFVGAPMLWFMRLTSDGVGMHVGILPGYPASHGCIRMPPQAAEMFFNKVKLGTQVQVMRD
jgi:lipoprotein-anchoring transpeptidase ErfK/SrfK